MVGRQGGEEKDVIGEAGGPAGVGARTRTHHDVRAVPGSGKRDRSPAARASARCARSEAGSGPGFMMRSPHEIPGRAPHPQKDHVLPITAHGCPRSAGRCRVQGASESGATKECQGSASWTRRLPADMSPTRGGDGEGVSPDPDPDEDARPNPRKPPAIDGGEAVRLSLA